LESAVAPVDPRNNAIADQCRTQANGNFDFSGGKSEAAAGRAQHELLRHFLFRQIDEVLSAAMHRQHVLEVKLLQLGHDLSQIVVRRRREVEAAQQRIDLLDSADLLRPPQRIDDAAMARTN
jgi:hypothetical protein